MGNAVVKTCDLCNEVMTKFFELRAVIVLHDNGHSRERYKNTECCGETCLSKAHAALVREVREAPVSEPTTSAPDCHALGQRE